MTGIDSIDKTEKQKWSWHVWMTESIDLDEVEGAFWPTLEKKKNRNTCLDEFKCLQSSGK